MQTDDFAQGQCEYHLERKGEAAPAACVVNDEPMCAQCFAGRAIHPFEKLGDELAHLRRPLAFAPVALSNLRFRQAPLDRMAGHPLQERRRADSHGCAGPAEDLDRRDRENFPRLRTARIIFDRGRISCRRRSQARIVGSRDARADPHASGRKQRDACNPISRRKRRGSRLARMSHFKSPAQNHMISFGNDSDRNVIDDRDLQDAARDCGQSPGSASAGLGRSIRFPSPAPKIAKIQLDSAALAHATPLVFRPIHPCFAPILLPSFCSGVKEGG